MQSHDGPEQSEETTVDLMVDLLHDELRAVRGTAIDNGADPDEVSEEIRRRVRRLRELNATGWGERAAERHVAASPLPGGRRATPD